MKKPNYFPDRVETCLKSKSIIDSSNGKEIFNVRDWGFLMMAFHSKDKADEEQYKWCEFVCEAINEKIERSKPNFFEKIFKKNNKKEKK